MQGGVSPSPDDGAGRAADWRVLDWIAMEGVVSAIVRAALGASFHFLLFWVLRKHVNMRIDPFLCVIMNDRPLLCLGKSLPRESKECNGS